MVDTNILILILPINSNKELPIKPNWNPTNTI